VQGQSSELTSAVRDEWAPRQQRLHQHQQGDAIEGAGALLIREGSDTEQWSSDSDDRSGEEGGATGPDGNCGSHEHDVAWWLELDEQLDEQLHEPVQSPSRRHLTRRSTENFEDLQGTAAAANLLGTGGGEPLQLRMSCLTGDPFCTSPMPSTDAVSPNGGSGFMEPISSAPTKTQVAFALCCTHSFSHLQKLSTDSVFAYFSRVRLLW
jgi:hypothetical protein